MFHSEDRGTDGLWDAFHFLGEKRRNLLERSWAGVFREQILPTLPVDVFKKRFHKSFGRPTKDQRTMLGILVLQQMLNLSDMEVIEQLAYNLQWHYALDIRDESDASKYVSERALRYYRSLVIDLGIDEILFASLTQVLQKAFKVNTDQQRLDSTHIQSNMRNLGRVGLFGKVIENFFKQMRKEDPELFTTRIEKELAELFLEKEKFNCFSRVKPNQGKKKSRELAEILYRLVRQFEVEPKVKGWESYQQLVRVFEENCRVVQEDGVRSLEVKKKKEIPSNCLQNPSDPDATYNWLKGQGYSVQLMETCNSKENLEQEDTQLNLITTVDVEQAHKSDANALIPAVEEAAKHNLQPKQLLADTNYGSDKNVEKAKQLGVTVITPTPPGKPPKSSRLPVRTFECSMEAGSPCRCPMGQITYDTKQTSEGGFVIQFDKEQCQACPERKRCPTSLTTATLTYDPRARRLAIRRNYEKTEEFTGTYRMRAGVEATFSQLKRQFEMKRLRVTTMPKVRYVVKLKALGLNIQRAARVRASKLPKNRPSLPLGNFFFEIFRHFPLKLAA